MQQPPVSTLAVPPQPQQNLQQAQAQQQQVQQQPQQPQTQQPPPSPKLCELRDLRPSVNSNVHTKFIILEKGQASRMSGAEGAGPLVSVALVADSTATVHLQLWGPECDAFQPSDIVRLTNGLFSFQKNNMVLRAGKKGQLEKIGQFTMTFVENPNMSRVQWVPDPSNSKLLVPNFSSPQGHGMLGSNFRG
ncbi:unnamed protein product [Calypogeia fissa]